MTEPKSAANHREQQAKAAIEDLEEQLPWAKPRLQSSPKAGAQSRSNLNLYDTLPWTTLRCRTKAPGRRRTNEIDTVVEQNIWGEARICQAVPPSEMNTPEKLFYNNQQLPTSMGCHKTCHLKPMPKKPKKTTARMWPSKNMMNCTPTTSPHKEYFYKVAWNTSTFIPNPTREHMNICRTLTLTSLGWTMWPYRTESVESL